jgi:hypothetical protein
MASAEPSAVTVSNVCDGIPATIAGVREAFNTGVTLPKAFRSVVLLHVTHVCA